MHPKNLTDEEKDFIYKNREKLTVGDIAKKLNRRYETINSFMRKNKISRLLKSTIIYPYSLTERELEVLGLMAKGYTNSEISEVLCISLSTVITHAHSIYSKLAVSEYKRGGFSVIRLKAVLKYQEMIREGLIDAET